MFEDWPWRLPKDIISKATYISAPRDTVCESGSVSSWRSICICIGICVSVAVSYYGNDRDVLGAELLCAPPISVSPIYADLSPYIPCAYICIHFYIFIFYFLFLFDSLILSIHEYLLSLARALVCEWRGDHSTYSSQGSATYRSIEYPWIPLFSAQLSVSKISELRYWNPWKAYYTKYQIIF